MINVIGLGYIGLPTALILSKNGFKVTGTDINVNTINLLKEGEISFNEKGLKELFLQAQEHDIKFSTEYIKTNFYIIAVPTPFIESNKKVDLSFVINAVQKVLDVCEENTIIVIESTISPGSIDNFIKPEILKRGYILGSNIHIAHAPERIIPGNMLFELENNSRIIGVENEEIGKKIRKIYSSFCKSDIVITDIKSAEMSKVVENTFRDINIAFANELTKICQENSMNVYEIIKLANMHPRVNILNPGPGVGGHCIPVDPWFLVGEFPKLTELIFKARSINESMPDYVMKRVKIIMKEKGILDFARVGIYGLTYKENVDDTRYSPAIQFSSKFNDKETGAMKYYDPLIIKKIVRNQYFNFNDFLNSIEILIIFASHDHIKENYDLIKNKIIFDTRNTIDIKTVYKL